jgi:hypothetical protein
MAVLAEITAIGGEVIHDLVIGAVPPVAFTDASYFWIPLLATGVTFFRTCADESTQCRGARVRLRRRRTCRVLYLRRGIGFDLRSRTGTGCCARHAHCCGWRHHA